MTLMRAHVTGPASAGLPSLDDSRDRVKVSSVTVIMPSIYGLRSPSAIRGQYTALRASVSKAAGRPYDGRRLAGHDAPPDLLLKGPAAKRVGAAQAGARAAVGQLRLGPPLVTTNAAFR